jgi:hypothetical protein
MNSASLAPERRPILNTARAAALALGGALYFAASIIVLHFLRPDLDPIQQPTSAYAVGPYGSVMTAAFFAMALGAFALVVAIARGVPVKGRSRAGLLFLGLWGTGVLIAMTFPMDAPGAPETLSGAVHGASGPFAFLSAGLALLLLSHRFKHAASWRAFHAPATALALVFMLGFVATLASFVTGSGILGFTQRVALITLVTWMALTARRLQRGAPLDA